MIKLSQLKCPVTEECDLIRLAASELHVGTEQIKDLKLLKKSIDARKKETVFFCYQAAVTLESPALEKKLLKKFPENRVSPYTEKKYSYRITGTIELSEPPVVVGTGPAGLMAAYHLARAGFRPLIIERGKCVEERERDVEKFFNENVLNPESNVQFGEGGAGTFSDGKLNTLIKDPGGYGAHVYRIFADFGAPEEITYLAKPHIGTDILKQVVRNLREEIIRLGGTFRFETKLTGLTVKENTLTRITVNDRETIPCRVLVLATGHSARDTLEMLLGLGVRMEPKPFAMGLRVQHPREMINRLQYGKYSGLLPSADYKLTYTTGSGRGVYSFCMCPGGFVVNASSEPGRITVNGMSNHDRMAENSNSAVVVTVTPEDFRKETGETCVLAGMHFQRKIEELAYREGKGLVPAQTYGDYMAGIPSTGCKSIAPCNKGAVSYGNLRNVLPNS